MKTIGILLIILTLDLTWTSAQAQNDSETAIINQCNNNKTYLTWKSRCSNNGGGDNQSPCYCAAAALLRCYITAAPNNPSVEQWKEAYQANVKQAQDNGTTCFNN